jgi:hypothetical protein
MATPETQCVLPVALHWPALDPEKRAAHCAIKTQNPDPGNQYFVLVRARVDPVSLVPALRAQVAALDRSRRSTRCRPSARRWTLAGPRGVVICWCDRVALRAGLTGRSRVARRGLRTRECLALGAHGGPGAVSQALA